MGAFRHFSHEMYTARSFRELQIEERLITFHVFEDIEICSFRFLFADREQGISTVSLSAELLI